jgi:hypothetical protein
VFRIERIRTNPYFSLCKFAVSIKIAEIFHFISFEVEIFHELDSSLFCAAIREFTLKWRDFIESTAFFRLYFGSRIINLRKKL